jgi:hypothetical protein
VIVVALATAREASAQHHHGAPGAPASRPFRAAVTMLAASFDTMFYAGDYEAVGVSFEWRAPRVGAHVAVPMYRLQENGATHLGAGDVMIGADVTAVRRDRWSAGAGLGATLPTGDPNVSLGMGHPMLMPSLWGAHEAPRWRGAVAVGVGRALAELGSAHDHGAMPLVEPMNGAELTAELRGEIVPWSAPVRAIARVSGAAAIGGGTHRAYGAVGATWRRGRIDTLAEIQLGLAGDPFTIRGLVETAVRF